jgi:hypothetical protein
MIGLLLWMMMHQRPVKVRVVDSADRQFQKVVDIARFRRKM